VGSDRNCTSATIVAPIKNFSFAKRTHHSLFTITEDSNYPSTLSSNVTDLDLHRYTIRCNMLKLALSSGIRRLSTTSIVGRSAKVNLFDLNFDRRIKVDYKDSIKYLESEAYKKTYQGALVWHMYKRNHKSLYPSENTRPNCINQDGFLTTSYPCSICRDEYLVLHPENVKLLSQFIDPYTGEIISRKKHGLCLKQYRNLIISVIQSKDLGLLVHELPDRLYDYNNYYKTD
jgi:small subunit ribosomal protein S18b